MRIHEDDSSSGAPDSMEHGDKAVEQQVENVHTHGARDEKNGISHAGEFIAHTGGFDISTNQYKA
jgi:hypothetical protein